MPFRMPRKKSPVFNNVSNTVNVSNIVNVQIFLAKMRTTTIMKLSYLRKSHAKKFKLSKNYNNFYSRHYQFSTSETRLVHYDRKKPKKKGYKAMDSIRNLCHCFGNFKEIKHRNREYPLAKMFTVGEAEDVGIELTKELSECSGEEDSVDDRAERFIEMFYDEMRRQRVESSYLLEES